MLSDQDCEPVQCSELGFNAIQARIPAWIPPIPEAITSRGDFDWEGWGAEKLVGKVKSGNWKGKVFRKMKIAIWEVGGHWTVDTDITVVYFTLH